VLKGTSVWQRQTDRQRERERERERAGGARMVKKEIPFGAIDIA